MAGKSLTQAAKAVLMNESDDPTPDRGAKATNPNMSTLRPGSKYSEGRFATPGATPPDANDYEDLGPALVKQGDVPPSAKASGSRKKDTSKSSQSSVPAEPAKSLAEDDEVEGEVMEEEIEISEELQAFIEEKLAEGLSEDEIEEAIAENFEIIDEDAEQLEELTGKGKLPAISKKLDDDSYGVFKKIVDKKATGSDMRTARFLNNKKGQATNLQSGNLSRASMYASQARREVSEETEDDTLELSTVDMREHVDALLEGENLSEDFRAKAETIFESAVKAKLDEEIAVLEQAYAASLEEQVSTIYEELSLEVENYLQYVIEQWIKDNEVAIESGLRTEITEGFISGLRSLFAEHYIDVPEDKVDVLDTLGEQVKELTDKLNEEIERNVALRSQLDESKKFEVLVTACEGLTATEFEKLKALAEGVEFTSAEEYETKINTLRESYFPNTVENTNVLDKAESVGGKGMINEQLSGPMSAYVNSLGRTRAR